MTHDDTSAPVGTQDSPATPTYSDEVTLGALTRPIRRGILLVPVVLVVCVLAATLFLKASPVLYAVDMTVVPVTQQQGVSEGGDGKLQLIGALLDGTGGGGSHEFKMFRASIGSIPVAEALQKKYGLLQQLNESLWNPETQTWRKPELGFWDSLGETLYGWFDMPYTHDPSLRSLAMSVGSMVEFEEVEESPMFRLKILSSEPDKALDILKRVYETTDSYLRDKRLAQLDQQLAFLTSKIQNVSTITHRDMLTSMISKVSMEIMLNRSGQPYAVEVVDPPTIDPVPASPKILKIYAAAILGGLLLGLIAAYLFGYFWKRGRPA